MLLLVVPFHDCGHHDLAVLLEHRDLALRATSQALCSFCLPLRLDGVFVGAGGDALKGSRLGGVLELLFGRGAGGPVPLIARCHGVLLCRGKAVEASRFGEDVRLLLLRIGIIT
jgi:hypothetical protein